MNIEIKEKFNCVVLKLDGNFIGGPDAFEFKNTIQKLINKNKNKIVVDLGNISYVNSTGLGIIFRGYRAIKDDGGDLKLASLNEKMKNLLSITKLNTIFEIYNSVDKAVKGFDSE